MSLGSEIGPEERRPKTGRGGRRRIPDIVAILPDAGGMQEAELDFVTTPIPPRAGSSASRKMQGKCRARFRHLLVSSTLLRKPAGPAKTHHEKEQRTFEEHTF